MKDYSRHSISKYSSLPTGHSGHDVHSHFPALRFGGEYILQARQYKVRWDYRDWAERLGVDLEGEAVEHTHEGDTGCVEEVGCNLAEQGLMACLPESAEVAWVAGKDTSSGYTHHS